MNQVIKKHSLSSAHISEIAFWVVNPEMIDVKEDSLFVLDRVFNSGTWNDIKAVLKYYGLRRIKKEIIAIPYLKGPALSFLCLITGLNKSDFYSMKQRQQRKPSVWKE